MLILILVLIGIYLLASIIIFTVYLVKQKKKRKIEEEANAKRLEEEAIRLEKQRIDAERILKENEAARRKEEQNRKRRDRRALLKSKRERYSAYDKNVLPEKNYAVKSLIHLAIDDNNDAYYANIEELSSDLNLRSTCKISKKDFETYKQWNLTVYEDSLKSTKNINWFIPW